MEFFCLQGIYDAKLGRNLNYNETLVVPIVENTPFEADLETSLAAAMENYPGTSAVLVRRHGFYVWGNSWQQAKVMAECFDYLFDTAVKMKQMGLDASVAPSDKNNGIVL